MKKFILLLFLISSVLIRAQENDQIEKTKSTQTLLQAITVTIGGDFIVTGSFMASKLQRLDFFITKLYTEAQLNALSGLNQIQTINQVKKEITKYTLRDITLKHADGTEEKIDLFRFRMTGDFKYNPYLKNDDVIIFPAVNNEKNFVEIIGAVNKPTKFHFVVGDKLSDAILFAGGLNTDAYDNIMQASISRLDKTGDNEDLITVNISDDFSLKAGDRIKILSDENNRKNYKVLVLGEVNNPGYVYITRDGVLLKDVLKSAGGLTPSASLDHGRIIRNYNESELFNQYKINDDYSDNGSNLLQPETKLKLEQMKDLLSMARLSNINEEDSLAFNVDNQLRFLKGETLVDFSKIYDDSSDQSKFIVKDGDLIYIPQKFDYVYVFGQVPVVGYVKYDQGKNYKYYINKAGGLAENAKDESDIVLIKEKDRNWITENKDNVEVEPGDFIYVPKEVPKSFKYYLEQWGSIASIVGTVATIILIIIQANK